VRLQRQQLWTIDPVLTELWSLLRRELRDAPRCDRLVRALLERGLRRDPLLAGDVRRAWEIGEGWADQGFSLTDRQAFAAIERTREWRAWSYDRDFSVIRLGPRRTQPIELLEG
jgi:predicted nucleic acid-binding protein